jgi:hypothetical protein
VLKVLEMTLPLLFSGIGFEVFLHSLGGRAKKAFESLGIPIVSDYFLRKGSTNPKAKP